MAQKAKTFPQPQKSGLHNRVDILEEEESGGVTPEQIKNILADPSNLPFMIGEAFEVDENGASYRFVIDGVAYEFPYVPVFSDIEEGDKRITVMTKTTLPDGRVVINVEAGNAELADGATSQPGKVPIYKANGRIAVEASNQEYEQNDSAPVSYVDARMKPFTPANIASNGSYLAMVQRAGTSPNFTYTMSYILISGYGGAPVQNTIVPYGTDGRVRVAAAVEDYDAVNLGVLNSRLSAAQRTAIDALDAGTATVADLINALKAT